MNRVIVVTGSSSGIGKALCDLFEKEGDIVIRLSRSVNETIENHIKCDVSKEDSIENAFLKISQKYGKIDIIINNAGYGVFGASELIPTEISNDIFDVNFFGVLNCSKFALKLMSKGAKIVNISSACALISLPYRSIYSATKAAVNFLSFGMKMELSKYGIDVCTICPGEIKTNFMQNRVRYLETNEKYGEMILQSFNSVEKRNNYRMSEEYVVKKIKKICEKRKLKYMYIIGKKYKFFYLISKIFPLNLFYKVVGKKFTK